MTLKTRVFTVRMFFHVGPKWLYFRWDTEHIAGHQSSRESWRLLL